jgi:hypothetical protein
MPNPVRNSSIIRYHHCESRLHRDVAILSGVKFNSYLCFRPYPHLSFPPFDKLRINEGGNPAFFPENGSQAETPVPTI